MNNIKIIYDRDGQFHSLKEILESFILEIEDPDIEWVKEYLSQWFDHPHLESISRGIVNFFAKEKERYH